MAFAENPPRIRRKRQLTPFLDCVLSNRAAPSRRDAAAAIGRRDARDARNEAPLGSLAGGTLAARFHNWRGASGRRYVCSVFPIRAGAAQGGLPDFDDAIILAVARRTGAPDARRIVAAFEIGSQTAAGEAQRINAALRAGASEWHVHLLAGTESGARRAAIRDISAPR